MVIAIVIVVVIIICLGAVLYKVLKEETAIIAEDKKKEEEVIKKNKKVNYVELIASKGLETVLEKIKDKPEEIDKMKSHIQIELRKASKEGNASKVREYNELLKKIDKEL